MNLNDILNNRYATKKFDPEKRLTDKQFEQIKSLLRLSPSSVNSQPWHFIVADSAEGKGRLAKSAEGAYAANHPKILEASHVVLFCAKTDITDEYMKTVTEQEDKDGRFPKLEGKEMVNKTRAFYVGLHKNLNDMACWAQKQVYLNIGNLLLGAGCMGIDAVPIEGVDLEVLNEEFELPEKGLTAVAVVALGYHAEGDFNATLPKSRFTEAELFTYL